MRNRTRCVAAHIGAIAMAVAVAGCAPHTDSATPHSTGTSVVEPSSAPRSIRASAYELSSDIDSAVKFFGNENIFEGEVIDTLPDTIASDRMDDGTIIEVVYTPIVIRVGKTHVGDTRAGDTVTVRSMGGTADGLSYSLTNAPLKSVFATGRTLVIFGGALTAVDSEAHPAITPNFIYDVRGGIASDASYGDVTTSPTRSQVSISGLRAKLRDR